MNTRWFAVAFFAAVAPACGGDDGGASFTMATAAIAGPGHQPLKGTASFMQGAVDTAADSVTLTLNIMLCTNAKSYPVHIHQGSGCADATAQGGHWDTTRGEGIPNIMCVEGNGTVVYNRAATDASLAWSVSGDSTTDVIGHTIVVHDADMPDMRIACGVISGAN